MKVGEKYLTETKAVHQNSQNSLNNKIVEVDRILDDGTIICNVDFDGEIISLPFDESELKPIPEKKDYGNITVGYGTREQREIKIVNYLQANYIDNRLVSVSELEDGSYILAIENPKSTGRTVQETMWLSKESFIALINTSMFYFMAKNEDLMKLIKESTDGDKIDYRFSDNLQPIKK